MDPRPHRLPVTTPRARGVRHERGFTTAHLLTGVAAIAVAVVLLVVATSSRPAHRKTPPPTATSPIEPVLRALDRDVADTVHALIRDTNGCGHAEHQRAVVSFLADGSAPKRASWYVEHHDGKTVLVRRECRNGHVVASGVVAPVIGTPLVACTPNCGHFDSVRFSYDGPKGLASVVAYRRAAAK
jgi:hypothetical protein